MIDLVYLRVSAPAHPGREVLVKTTRDRYKQRYKAVLGDLRKQKFARWRAFAGETTHIELIEPLDDLWQASRTTLLAVA